MKHAIPAARWRHLAWDDDLNPRRSRKADVPLAHALDAVRTSLHEIASSPRLEELITTEISQAADATVFHERWQKLAVKGDKSNYSSRQNIELPSSVAPEAGDHLYVSLYLEDRGIADDAIFTNNLTTHAPSKPSQIHYSEDGVNWSDLYGVDSTANASRKAPANEASPQSPVFTYSNSELIYTPSKQAIPYPSEITVSGVEGLITDINVTLHELESWGLGALDILLVGPGYSEDNSQRSLLMSDAGPTTYLYSGILNLVFDQEALQSLPQYVNYPSGVYRPTNYGPGDSFNLPAPQFPVHDTDLSAFYGSDPNGTWKLYVMNDSYIAPLYAGIGQGWSITFETDQGQPPHRRPVRTQQQPDRSNRSGYDHGGDHRSSTLHP